MWNTDAGAGGNYSSVLYALRASAMRGIPEFRARSHTQEKLNALRVSNEMQTTNERKMVADKKEERKKKREEKCQAKQHSAK